MRAGILQAGLSAAILTGGAARGSEPRYRLAVDSWECRDEQGNPGLNPGWLGECGDLRGARLDRADLRGLDLQSANLEGASLKGARLDGAALDHARLTGADLEGASLVGASLRDASLDRCNLERADFSQAFLFNASLREANLRGARLERFPSGLRVERNEFRDALVDDRAALSERLRNGGVMAIEAPRPPEPDAPEPVDSANDSGPVTPTQAAPAAPPEDEDSWLTLATPLLLSIPRGGARVAPESVPGVSNFTLLKP